MKSIVFFNNKGGVGKTSLVYHLTCMYADLGLRVLAVDLDPQSNLTAMFLDEEKLETLWNTSGKTISDCLQPLKQIGDIQEPHIEHISNINENIGLLAGNLTLSDFEDFLSDRWYRCLTNEENAFYVMSSFYRIMKKGAEKHKADIVLVDVGPNLGAINRTALLSSHYVCIPLGPDLFSIQGLHNIGPTLKMWHNEWKKRLDSETAQKALNNIDLPKSIIEPIGYVIMQHSIRSSKPVKSYEKWMNRIPAVYRSEVLNQEPRNFDIVTDDQYCLKLVKHYRSLMPMAMEVRKPMFHLTPADGAIGAHTYAVSDCFEDFKQLALRIGIECDFAVPELSK